MCLRTYVPWDLINSNLNLSNEMESLDGLVVSNCVCKHSRTVYLQRCKGAGQHWPCWKATETWSRIVSFALVKTGGNKGVWELIMWDVQAYLIHIMLNISVISLQMAQFTENVGVLTASNRNSISPLDLCVKWIKCKWGRCVETCDAEPLMKGSD